MLLMYYILYTRSPATTLPCSMHAQRHVYEIEHNDPMSWGPLATVYIRRARVRWRHDTSTRSEIVSVVYLIIKIWDIVINVVYIILLLLINVGDCRVHATLRYNCERYPTESRNTKFAYLLHTCWEGLACSMAQWLEVEAKTRVELYVYPIFDFLLREREANHGIIMD